MRWAAYAVERLVVRESWAFLGLVGTLALPFFTKLPRECVELALVRPLVGSCYEGFSDRVVADVIPFLLVVLGAPEACVPMA